MYTCRFPKDWTMPLGTTFSVYGWGHNHRGQLGGVEGNKIKSPKLCESFSELNPVSISGGEQTLFAITQDGKVIRRVPYSRKYWRRKNLANVFQTVKNKNKSN